MVRLHIVGIAGSEGLAIGSGEASQSFKNGVFTVFSGWAARNAFCANMIRFLVGISRKGRINCCFELSLFDVLQWWDLRQGKGLMTCLLVGARKFGPTLFCHPAALHKNIYA